MADDESKDCRDEAAPDVETAKPVDPNPSTPSGAGTSHLVFACLLVLAGSLVLFAATAYLGWWWASPPLRSLAVYGGLTAWAAALTVAFEALRRRKSLSGFLRLYQPTAVFAAAVVSTLYLLRLFLDVRAGATTPAGAAGALGAASWGIAFVALAVAGYAWSVESHAGGNKVGSRYLRALCYMLRGEAALAFLTGLALLCSGYRLAWPEPVVGGLNLLILVVLLVEIALNLVVAFFRPRPAPEKQRPPFGSVVLALLLARKNPLDGVVEGMREQFNIDLRATWAFRFLKRAWLPLLMAQALAFVALTCFVVIRPYEVGILEVWGVPMRSAVLGPGLHLKPPWPAGKVVKVPVRRIFDITLGVEGDIGVKILLWAKKHWASEYKLLLGDGNELLTFNAALQYRIKNPYAYTYKHAAPRALLAAEGYRIFTEETVQRDVTGVLSRDRREFARTVRRKLQSRLDELEAGIEIVAVALKETHPPVDVAAAYQDVVSAQIEMGTRVLEAEVYRTAALPATEAEAERLVKTAEAMYAESVEGARGKAARYLATYESYKAFPRLYRWRRYLEASERALAKSRTIVVDHTLPRDREYWLDLREKR